MRVKRGFAIPVSLCVAGVVLFLGGSIAQLSSGDLQLSNHEYYQERARQVADFGLESGIANLLTTNKSYTYQGTSGCNSSDSAEVVIYDNRLGNLSKESGCPVAVPPGFQYWVSTGRASNGPRTFATVRLGALVRWGMPMGSAGAQIRYLKADSSNGPVTYRAVDHTNAPIPDKVLCATEASNADLPPLNPTGLVKPVTLQEVQSFQGKLRIPQGADFTQVVQADLKTPGDTLLHDATGGFFNVPDYSPPVPKKVYSIVPSQSGIHDLLPGQYDVVHLPPDAELKLNGVYHFKQLILEPKTGDAVGRLSVGNVGSAQVFIDQIVNPGQLALGLRNSQTSAAAFRLNLKPPASPSTLHLRVNASYLTGEGGVTVIAPKQLLKVTGAQDRLIRGSFCCETLSLSFQQPGGGPDLPPTFVYDTSADTSRGKEGGGGKTKELGPDPVTTSASSLDQPMLLSKIEL